MVSESEYCVAVKDHYVQIWDREPDIKRWTKGPAEDLGPGFAVLCFAPTKRRTMWTYATVGMSSPSVTPAVELHLFSAAQDDSQVELLTVIAHYHRTGSRLNVDHTVNFGRPWVSGSSCEFGLLSLPYLDGPQLENLETGDLAVRFLWLIPITLQEREYKKTNGIEALEERMEKAQFNYLDPRRKSTV